MPIIDILGGVLTGSNNGSSGSSSDGGTTSTVGNGLGSLANSVLPGLGGILNSILGGLACLGSQSFKKEDYEIRVNECAQIVNTIVQNPANLGIVQDRMNFLMYIVHRDQTTLGKLQNACSKQWCQKTIQYCQSVESALVPFYTYSRYFKSYQDVNAGTVNVQEYTITGYKGGLTPNVIPTIPTTPTTPANPPTTPSTPTTPVTVNNNDGTSTTYIPDPTTGTTTVSTYNPANSQTSTNTVPTSSLEIGGYYDSNGNWVVTVGDGKSTLEKNMPYILGGVGLLGLILISKKKK